MNVDNDSGEVLKGMKDLPALIVDEEYEEVMDVLKREAINLKFNPLISRQKRKAKLKLLQGYLSNARSHARASREFSLNSEFKSCSSILYDSAR